MRTHSGEINRAISSYGPGGSWTIPWWSIWGELRNFTSSFMPCWAAWAGSAGLRSAAVRILQDPGARLRNAKPPILTRMSRKVGCPMAAVMRRTWRFLPSVNSKPIQQVGTVLRKRIGGIARGNLRLRFENPGAAGQRSACLKGEPLAELEQRVRRGNSFDLGPVFALVGVARVQKQPIQPGFVAEQQQSLGVGVQPAQGIDVPGETEFGQGAIGRPIGREAGEDAAGFVERDEHDETG